jgi:hypothetical protein
MADENSNLREIPDRSKIKKSRETVLEYIGEKSEKTEQDIGSQAKKELDGVDKKIADLNKKVKKAMAKTGKIIFEKEAIQNENLPPEKTAETIKAKKAIKEILEQPKISPQPAQIEPLKKPLSLETIPSKLSRVEIMKPAPPKLTKISKPKIENLKKESDDLNMIKAARKKAESEKRIAEHEEIKLRSLVTGEITNIKKKKIISAENSSIPAPKDKAEKKMSHQIKKTSFSGNLLNAIAVCFFGIGLFLSVYLLFVFSIITMKLDNSTSRKIDKIFPVPAIVGRSTFVDYYIYLDTKNALRNSNPGVDDIAIKKAILNELKKGKGEKYRIWSFVD